MNLKTRTRTTVQNGSDDELEKLVSEEPRTVRFALGLTYHEERGIRARAARAVALASRHHPALVQSVIRRIVWAMNDESGTNAATAPEVLQAIADEMPELLVPVIPDLVRLSADPELCEGLAAALRTVSRRCPGEIGQQLAESLNDGTRSEASPYRRAAARRLAVPTRPPLLSRRR
ncbi:MAG: hypothetical protein ABIK09_16975 [Pseudomonadota bacterium]